jgi:hypothetical protein
MLLQRIRKVIAIALVVASLGYIGFAAYILNSLPDQIAESKTALEKNRLQQEIRDAYNSQTAQP